MFSFGDISITWFLGTILLFCLFIIFFWFFQCQLRIIWLALRLPGGFFFLLNGSTLLPKMDKCFHEMADTCRKDFGSIFRIWVSLFPVFVVLEPDHIQKILSSSRHINKLYFYQFFNNFLGEGLVTINGGKWRRHRRLIQPFFHIKTLENLFEVSRRGSEFLVAGIENEIQKRSSQFNTISLINQTLLAVLTETVFGIPMDRILVDEKKSSFRKALEALMRGEARPWYLPEWVYKLTKGNKREQELKNILSDFFQKILKERRNGTHDKECFLDFVLNINKTHEDFSEEDCFQECRTFMLAGQDSVATTLAFFLHEIAKHPEVQEKIVEELNTVLGSLEKPLTFTALGELKYLGQCIKESMRLRSSVPLISRTLGEDVRLGEYTLPKGCGVLFSMYVTHRLDDYFENPEVFNPDRFHSTKEQFLHPYGFLPFSAGPRNCLGYKFAMHEMKTMAAMVLKKYRLSPVPNKEKLNIKCQVVLRSSGGVWVDFTPRSQTESLSL